MLFNLDVIDISRNPFNASQVVIESQLINLTDAITDSMTVSLEGGNAYNVVFPADANAPTSTVTVSFPEEPALDFTTTAGQLASGVTIPITPTVDITTINFSVLSTATETYDATVTINGENITITLDWGAAFEVFTGVNSITDFIIPDNSVLDITVQSAGMNTYQNQVTLYTNEVEASVLLQPTLTGIEQPYANFFYIIEPCTYNVHIYSGVADVFPLDGIYYLQGTDEFSVSNRNTVYSPCQVAVFPITQRIDVREIPNCGGTSPLAFSDSYTISDISVTEYRPEVTLNRAFDCCETLDEEITIFPTSIELRAGTIHDHCDIATAVTDVLEYTVVAPDGATVLNTTYTGVIVEAGPLSSLSAVFTPDQLGTYTVTVEVTNCCDTRTYEYQFDSCMSWVITNTNCNIIDIQNLSSLNSISYDIKALTDYSTFETVNTGTVTVGSTESIDLVNDNLYTVTITDAHPSTEDDEQIFLLDCNIKKCKKQFLIDVLCDNLDECDKEARIELLAEFAEFKALEEIVYQKWDEWKVQQSIVDTFSINDIMEDVIALSKAISAMLKICNECVTLSDEDCGCN